MSDDVTEDEFWRDGYDTGHEDGAAGWPNMLDVLGRPMAEVIPLRPRGIQRSGDPTAS
jgi:hypothetical protein